MKSPREHSSNGAPDHHPNRRSGRLRAFAAAAVVLSIAAAAAFKPVHALQIRAVKRSRVVFLEQVSPGDRFSTGYVHSVELSPVREYFCIDNDYRIILRETTFRSSNVGSE